MSAENRYRLVTDDDGHWYVIPAGRADDWERWVGEPNDPYPPEDLARPVNGWPGRVSFAAPELDGEPMWPAEAGEVSR